MKIYILRRLAQSFFILLGVSFITFLLLYILPADPARQIAGRSATPESVANIRAQLGLDQPLFVQYWHYLVNLFQTFIRAIKIKTTLAPTHFFIF